MGPHADEDVRRFYAASGRQMFDPRLLTRPIRALLKEEARMVARIMSSSRRRHLFEVGCGPGRYLRWAHEAGYEYDGVDLVAELVEEGRRVHRSPRLHVGSAERIAELFRDQGVSGERALVLFPFNCFGNLARAERAVESLGHTSATALLSVFEPTEQATELRMSYYASLGCREVTSQWIAGRGRLVTSSDGLRSFAYSSEYLRQIFAARGFVLRPVARLGEIGRLMSAVPMVKSAVKEAA